MTPVAVEPITGHAERSASQASLTSRTGRASRIPGAPSVPAAPVARGPRPRRLSAGALALITRQLATLLGAGLTVEQTMNALIEQADNESQRQLLAGIRSDVLAGQPLARAIGNQRSVFPEVYRTLVDAGERSGQLPEVLMRLADYTEERELLRGTVVLAFVYPALVVTVAILVVGGLLIYVVPQVVQVFQNTNQKLPWLTSALIAVSDFLRAGWPFILGGIAVAAFMFRQTMKIDASRARFQSMLLRLPLIGPLYRGINTARLASTLAILVGSRVPLLISLKAGAGVVSNIPMRRALTDASQKVQEGATLSRALGMSKMFPALMVHMIASGESSGRLAEMLERTATQQSRELERRISAFVKLLEPALILVMGGVVLVIVLAILLPIFELNQIVR